VPKSSKVHYSSLSWFVSPLYPSTNLWFLFYSHQSHFSKSKYFLRCLTITYPCNPYSPLFFQSHYSAIKSCPHIGIAAVAWLLYSSFLTVFSTDLSLCSFLSIDSILPLAFYWIILPYYHSFSSPPKVLNSPSLYRSKPFHFLTSTLTIFQSILSIVWAIFARMKGFCLHCSFLFWNLYFLLSFQWSPVSCYCCCSLISLVLAWVFLVHAGGRFEYFHFLISASYLIVLLLGIWKEALLVHYWVFN